MQIATLEVRKVWKVRKFNNRLFFFLEKVGIFDVCQIQRAKWPVSEATTGDVL